MRYVVIGTSGAGKSTFARALARATRFPYVELDELHWSANWRPRPLAEFEERVRVATAGERSVVDGNYSAVRSIVWPRATHIAWLNFTRSVVFSRIIRRTLHRAVTRKELWHGNRESFGKALFSRESILLWSFSTYARNRDRYAALREAREYSHLAWTELRNPASARAYLRLQAAPHSPSIDAASSGGRRTPSTAPHVDG